MLSYPPADVMDRCSAVPSMHFLFGRPYSFPYIMRILSTVRSGTSQFAILYMSIMYWGIHTNHYRDMRGKCTFCLLTSTPKYGICALIRQRIIHLRGRRSDLASWRRLAQPMCHTSTSDWLPRAYKATGFSLAGMAATIYGCSGSIQR